MSPSHLAQPSERGTARLFGDIMAIEKAPTAEAAVIVLDRRDEIFIDLIRTRRAQSRTRRRQFLTRRRLNRKVAALQAELAAL